MNAHVFKGTQWSLVTWTLLFWVSALLWYGGAVGGTHFHSISCEEVQNLHQQRMLFAQTPAHLHTPSSSSNKQP